MSRHERRPIDCAELLQGREPLRLLAQSCRRLDPSLKGEEAHEGGALVHKACGARGEGMAASGGGRHSVRGRACIVS